MDQRSDKQATACLFREWYMNLDKQRNLHTIARERILDACTIDINTFYWWLDGDQVIPPGAQSIISQIAGERIFHTNSNDIPIPLSVNDVRNKPT